MVDAEPPAENPSPRSLDPIEPLIRQLLGHCGEDPDREGLRRTPERVAKSMRFLLGGYGMDVESVIRGATFTESHEEMVLVKDIELYSLCEHHLLPFHGKVHVAYFPNGRILGLSKIARVVDVFARRLQVQERLTTQIAEALDTALAPQGVAVVIEAVHLCMMMRGVQRQGSSAVTSSLTGAFRHDEKSRAEFLQLIRRG